MAVDIETIKRLKSLTGVGLTDAKKALEEVDGDFDKAVENMRVKGMAKADKKSEREARSGIVDAYIHGDRIGVVLEVNCETDFVARTDDFKDFVHNVAMHIAASSPAYVSVDDIDEAVQAKEMELIAEELKNEGKPAEMIEKISDGKIKKWQSEICLLNQPYIKNPDETVEEYLKTMVAKLGENIVIRKFARIELGTN
jgi:elongation factor Ts